jgi:hypothetical protein
MKRSLFSLVAALALLAAMAVPVAAHSQTVTPPGQDGAVVSGPISQRWAQAHCHAAAPAVVAGASKGVVVFTPQAALDCLDEWLNPGDQVTGP